MGVHVDTLSHPWLWWQYLTAGFAHSPNGVGHILGNMFVLFFLGQDVEETYGSKEFLRLYLALVVFSSFAWNVCNLIGGLISPVEANSMMYGGSGAIAGVVVLYALNFPKRTILLFFVIPMPAWMFGVLAIVLDVSGALGGPVGYEMSRMRPTFRRGLRLALFPSELATLAVDRRRFLAARTALPPQTASTGP